MSKAIADVMELLAVEDAPDTRRIFLEGEVDEKRAKRIMRELNEIRTYDKGAPVELIINSQGGTISDGISIYSELSSMSKRLGGNHHVTTTVRGMCGSISTVIFQAGDVRRGGELDVLVFHEPRVYLHGEFLSQAKQYLVDVDRWENECMSILMQRATAPRNVIQALEGPMDRQLLIREAVALGLADTVDVAQLAQGKAIQ